MAGYREYFEGDAVWVLNCDCMTANGGSEIERSQVLSPPTLGDIRRIFRDIGISVEELTRLTEKKKTIIEIMEMHGKTMDDLEPWKTSGIKCNICKTRLTRAARSKLFPDEQELQ